MNFSLFFLSLSRILTPNVKHFFSSPSSEISVLVDWFYSDRLTNTRLWSSPVSFTCTVIDTLRVCGLYMRYPVEVSSCPKCNPLYAFGPCFLPSWINAYASHPNTRMCRASGMKWNISMNGVVRLPNIVVGSLLLINTACLNAYGHRYGGTLACSI